jgi:lipopolysaccharide transport system ATP-binding protein
MSEIAIKVEGLGKRYRIGADQQAYKTLKEKLSDTAATPFRALRSLAGRNRHSSNGHESNGHSNGRRTKAPTIWAVRDVSFEISRGEVVGIIGRNGAGKSTLLKILSRITDPTEGYADIHGRIASLLEVGTGFQPELSGRENIFLNGSILGMKRAEIRKKFDEIVAFSEVDKFIDTPVKHYSSGMYVRLAFAVAAHLEPDILLVDEVLAVGDAGFQKKCLGKMGQVAREGRTVLFVSHNTSAVVSLCKRALLLESGSVAMDGPATEVTASYQFDAAGVKSNQTDLREVPHKGSGKARFVSIDLKATDRNGAPLHSIVSGCEVRIETTIQCLANIQNSNVAVIIYDSNGYRLIDVNTAMKGEFLSMQAGAEATVRFLLREVLLKPGSYYVGLWIGRGGVEEMDSVEYATRMDVIADVENVKHTEVFPGPYVCRFDAMVEAN